METFKSPRKIEEEVKDYQRSRFEVYMLRVDSGELTVEEAIAEFESEIENTIDLS